MKIWKLGLALLGLALPAVAARAWPQSTATANPAKTDPPAWAYVADVAAEAPAKTAAPTDTAPRHVAGSALAFTSQQVHDHYAPADWHPADHGPAPEIVEHGKKPEVTACALCHYANGEGRPQNAALAGLSADYFTQQMMDFKEGNRKSSEAGKTNTKEMIAFAKAMTDAEIKASAAYFGALSYGKWIRVVESATAPKTGVVRGMIVKLDGAQTEPVGDRIIEIAENADATRLHDDHSGFVAYVPPGSIARGEALATGKGGAKGIACIHCHGGDLTGLGDSPPLAGRSPSYLARQIHDFQTGARNGFGVLTPTMVMAVDKLTPDDIVAVSAYLASLPVSAAETAPKN